MARTWTSPQFHLVGNNKIWLKLILDESISGTTNNVSLRLYACTSYIIEGSWYCESKINGESSGLIRKPIYHGSMSSGGETLIASMSRSFTYEGNRNINISGHIRDMDYQDIVSGNWGKFNINHEVNNIGLAYIQPANRPPGNVSLTIHHPKPKDTYVVEDNIHVSLSQTSDPEGKKVRYVIYGKMLEPNGQWKSLGDVNNCILWSQTAREKTVDIRNHPRGTRYEIWGKAEDETNLATPLTPKINNIYKNRAPNKITTIRPESKSFYTDTFTISWDKPVDPDGQSVSYSLSMKKNNGAYQLIKENFIETSYTHNIANDEEGDTYVFKIFSTDGITNSLETVSPVYIKGITTPLAPTNIQPSSGFYLNEVNITWNASVDPNGELIKRYDVFINDTLLIGTSDKPFIKWAIPYGDAEGTAYTVSVEGTDASNNTSPRGYATSPFYKARTPAQPVLIENEDYFYEGSIKLKWNEIFSNNVKCQYELSYKIDEGQWIELVTVSATEYTHLITSIARGSKILYRIRTVNTFGQKSDWVISKEHKRNNIPKMPKILYPNNYSTIFNKRPDIGMTIFNELDNQHQIIIVKYNDTIYDSVNHSEMFSNKNGTFQYETTLTFKPEELNVGRNEIDVFVNDGLVDSSITKIVLFVNDGAIQIDEYITTEPFYDVRDKVNVFRAAYGLSPIDFTNPLVSNITYIEYEKTIGILREGVNEVINKINILDPAKNIIIDWQESGKYCFINRGLLVQIIDTINSI